MNIGKLNLVLVRSLYASNIGYCSRAMSNIGGEQMILIQPEADIADYSARHAAAGGQAALVNHKQYKDWPTLLNSEADGIRIAFSCRSGKMRKTESFELLLEQLHHLHGAELWQKPVYLVMGPEDSGLSSEDMDHCHHFAHLPTYGTYESMNLAHASLLALFIFRHFLASKNLISSTNLNAVAITNEEAAEEQKAFSTESFKQFLNVLGFEKNDSSKSLFQSLSQMLMRAIPNKRESELWEKVFRQATRKLQSIDKGPKSP